MLNNISYCVISLAILDIRNLNYFKIIKKCQSNFETKIYEVLIVKNVTLHLTVNYW